ncbi:MAG: hypothetical protein JWN67_5010 [Actinomycetia bacterium]|nr:hypothetical protein [Actinomycetes bacterium]
MTRLTIDAATAHQQLVCVLVADTLRAHGFDATPTESTVEVTLTDNTVTLTFAQLDLLAALAVQLQDQSDGEIPAGRAFASQIHMVANLLTEIDADRCHALAGGDR